jgi:putative ABC transport system permease protein
MLWIIAWRNVWRNKKRSAIIIVAIAFGLWAGLLSMGFSLGWVDQMINSAISTRLSHFQLHCQGFLEHKEIGATIPDGNKVLEQVCGIPGVKAATGRVVIAGMASSAATGSGVIIYGITPSEEKTITDLYTQITEGSYFESNRSNQVVIGEKLAERLEVGVGKKIILTAQTTDGKIGAGAFRVVGIYKTVSSLYDQSTVFVQRTDVSQIFGLDDRIHEIALLLNDVNKVDELTPIIQSKFPELKVSSWKDLAPELAMSIEMTDQMLYIFLIIILLALVFGITNTMLMGVLERVREFGVVMALGMKGLRIFSMIVLETVFLSILGGILGIIFGAVTIGILSHTGIDLSLFEAGLSQFGSSSIIYPFLPLSKYPTVVALVIATALVSATYPGIKAVRLNPVQAIRTY